MPNSASPSLGSDLQPVTSIFDYLETFQSWPPLLLYQMENRAQVAACVVEVVPQVMEKDPAVAPAGQRHAPLD